MVWIHNQSIDSPCHFLTFILLSLIVIVIIDSFLVRWIRLHTRSIRSHSYALNWHSSEKVKGKKREKDRKSSEHFIMNFSSFSLQEDNHCFYFFINILYEVSQVFPCPFPILVTNPLPARFLLILFSNFRPLLLSLSLSLHTPLSFFLLFSCSITRKRKSLTWKLEESISKIDSTNHSRFITRNVSGKEF